MSLHGGAQAHIEAARDAIRRLLHDPIRHSVGCLVMALMLALPGVAWVALRGFDVLLPVEATTPGLSVFVRQDVAEADLTALADNLLARDNILTVEVVGRDKGLEALSQLAGLGDLVGAFDENPLPDVIRVALKTTPGSEFMRGLSVSLEGDPRVEFVRVDQGLSNEMRNALVLGQRLVLVLALMVLAAIVLVVTGATRIEVTRARAELSLVDLVGGTERYARRPFIYMGVLQGAAGGCLAALFVWIGSLLVGAPLSRLLTLYGESGAIVGANALDLALPVLAGTVLGGVGARIAARVPSVAWT
ncbi:MAG: cell division protein FtsX [Litorivicinus sp.]